jgi:hypothetical protein
MRSWFDGHEGAKAMAAMKELAAIVPQGRDLAMELALEINKDVNGPGELGLSQFEFYTNLGDPAVRDLMVWSMENQGASPGDFRVLAAYSLPWVLGRDDLIARFAGAIDREADASVQTAILANLAGMNSPKAEALLARVFSDPARDASLRAQAVTNLAASKDAAIAAAIDNAAASDPVPQVRAAARAVQVARDPPASGFLVTGTAPQSLAEAAGLQAGDIVTTYAGRAIDDDAALRQAVQSAGSAETVSLVVVRDGHEQTVTVRPGRLGVYGRAVEKKK